MPFSLVTWVLIITEFIDALVIIPITWLFGYHVWLQRQNMTTYEHILQKRQRLYDKALALQKSEIDNSIDEKFDTQKKRREETTYLYHSHHNEDTNTVTSIERTPELENRFESRNPEHESAKHQSNPHMHIQSLLH